jgi:hypothetical protein
MTVLPTVVDGYLHRALVHLSSFSNNCASTDIPAKAAAQDAQRDCRLKSEMNPSRSFTGAAYSPRPDDATPAHNASF